MKTETDSKCGLWQKYKATQHILSACPLLANEQYVKWLDRAYAQLRFNCCKKGGIKLVKERWCEQFRKSLEAGHEINVAILCNQQIKAYRTIHKNILVIVIRDTEQGACLSIDTEISGDRNVIKKEAEKF